jgi:hypothetical protein
LSGASFSLKDGTAVSFHSAITMLQTEQIAESLSVVGNRLIVTS